jgi:hypothetical protein
LTSGSNSRSSVYSNDVTNQGQGRTKKQNGSMDWSQVKSQRDGARSRLLFSEDVSGSGYTGMQELHYKGLPSKQWGGDCEPLTPPHPASAAPLPPPSEGVTVKRSVSGEAASSSTTHMVEEEEEVIALPIVTATALLGLDIATSGDDEDFHTPRGVL